MAQCPYCEEELPEWLQEHNPIECIEVLRERLREAEGLLIRTVKEARQHLMEPGVCGCVRCSIGEYMTKYGRKYDQT